MSLNCIWVAILYSSNSLVNLVLNSPLLSCLNHHLVGSLLSALHRHHRHCLWWWAENSLRNIQKKETECSLSYIVFASVCVCKQWCGFPLVCNFLRTFCRWHRAMFLQSLIFSNHFFLFPCSRFDSLLLLDFICKTKSAFAIFRIFSRFLLLLLQLQLNFFSPWWFALPIHFDSAAFPQQFHRILKLWLILCVCKQ